MASAKISLSLPPEIDILNIPVAYGRRAIPKLNEQLQSESLKERQKALCVLSDFVHCPEYVYQAILAGACVCVW